MERFDFCSLMKIVWAHRKESVSDNQSDFCAALFCSYSNDCDDAFHFDAGKCSRWFTGKANVPQELVSYYSDGGLPSLANDYETGVVPLLDDPPAMLQEVSALFLQDPSISAAIKELHAAEMDLETAAGQSDYMADMLLFSMERHFVKRDGKTLIPAGGQCSPLLVDQIFGCDPPRPCHYFCGREDELAELHQLLKENSKVFLQGLPGIGKSELAKKYAAMYKGEYTNILYLAYTGDLKRDIAEMDFSGDLAIVGETELFRQHNRFLRRLPADTLLIIDNFNTTPAKESVFDIVMKYNCRVLFTSRSRFSAQPTLPVTEFSDVEPLLELVGKLYPSAKDCAETMRLMLEAVHRHTLAAELIARLLAHGILSPEELLTKLQTESVALSASDEIQLNKDGTFTQATYYNHIRTLFALYRLSAPQMEIMRALALMPPDGIEDTRLAGWMKQDNLNLINGLSELGFVQPTACRRVVLHPMLQEVVIAEDFPSFTNCPVLIASIMALLLHQGELFDYASTVFGVIRGIITHAKKDAPTTYIAFLEDGIAFVDCYERQDEAEYLMKELELYLAQNHGTAKDKAVLLDYKASLEGKYKKNYRRAVELDSKAYELITECDYAENIIFHGNVQNNLALWYSLMHDNRAAAYHAEQCETTWLAGLIPFNHNMFVQMCNAATIWNNIGKPSRGLQALLEVERYCIQNGYTDNPAYAELLQRIGTLQISLKQFDSAKSYLVRAYKLYQICYATEPKLMADVNLQYRQLVTSLGGRFVPELPLCEADEATSE